MFLFPSESLPSDAKLTGGGWYNKEEPLQPLYPGPNYGGDSGFNPGGGDYEALLPGGGGGSGFNPGTYQPLVPGKNLLLYKK